MKKDRLIEKALVEAGMSEDEAKKIAMIARELKKLDAIKREKDVNKISIRIVDSWINDKDEYFIQRAKPILIDIVAGMVGSGLYDLILYFVEILRDNITLGHTYQAGPDPSALLEKDIPPTLYAIVEEAIPIPDGVAFGLTVDSLHPLMVYVVARISMKRAEFILQWAQGAKPILEFALNAYINKILTEEFRKRNEQEGWFLVWR